MPSDQKSPIFPMSSRSIAPSLALSRIEALGFSVKGFTVNGKHFLVARKGNQEVCIVGSQRHRIEDLQEIVQILDSERCIGEDNAD